MSNNIYTGEKMESINRQFEPSNDTTIFRYMDFSKFMDLLENKNLYFCRSDGFEDDYEGKMPEGFYKGWPEDYVNNHKIISKKSDEVIGTYISCWNEAENESYALWKIYTNPNTGMAIKSTIKDLKKALNNESIKIYKTKYINSFYSKDEDYELPFYLREAENNLLIQRRVKEAYKLKTYQYENEIRAIYVDVSKSRGKSFDVDLNKLIKEIYISPFAPEWFSKLIDKIISNSIYNLSTKPIKKSEIILRRSKH